MVDTFTLDTRRAIRMAMVRDSYDNDRVRIVDPDLSERDWLVATHKGLFAVSLSGARLVAHGWFFGICLHGQNLFLFENCAQRNRTLALGRIVRMTIVARKLADPLVLTKGLHANCHQIAVIDGLLCVVDTANQAILRFKLDGTPVDIKTPFLVSPPNDRSGAHLHINSIAQIGDRIVAMLHNGKALPEKCSELAWLDADWNLCERVPLAGHHCHDIVEDETGVLWHSASMTGELLSSAGCRVKIDADRMTRGLALTADTMIVGVSSFGPRQNRDALPGAVVVLDRMFNRLAEIELGGPPADIVAIRLDPDTKRDANKHQSTDVNDAIANRAY